MKGYKMKSKKIKRIDVYKKRAAAAATWRKRRQSSELDAKQFAKKYGFIESQITRWETGESIPGFFIIEEMEKALKKEGV